MQKLEDVPILMKNVNYVTGNENIKSTPLKVYSDEVCKFLNDLSSELLKSPSVRMYPDLSAVAFWCRKANIQKLKTQFGNCDLKTGRGLCFHIAPSNIPVNFAFSYFFSLLAGNANIVRLPSKDFPQVDILIEIIKNTLKNYPQIEERTAFVKYERNNEITAEFSQKADCRMIWGGDKTIETVRAMKTKPRCIDIAFADRYSVCLINADEINNSDENIIKRLAENFYNDTYLMDQNACSSPQLIYWLNDNEQARNIFWNAVLNLAKQKYNLQAAVCVDKYTNLCENAIDYYEIINNVQNYENLLYRCELKNINSSVEKLRGKGGYFYEYSLQNLNEFFEIVNEKYQTITYFGINSCEIGKEITNHNLNGIDRIVPIGKAMDIGVMWDGHNLVAELSRTIICE